MDDLGEFIKTTRARLDAVLKGFNWTEEELLREFEKKEDEKETGFTTDEEPPLPPSCADTNSVVLDEKELQKLLGKPNVKAPQKFSDLQINFSREEKLLIYEHTVKQKKDLPNAKPPEKDLVSYGDILAMKKRERTNRRKYRISKPTQTEEVRSLVELQMQALQQYLETKQKNDTDETAIKKKGENQYRSNDIDSRTEKDYRTHKRREDESNISKERKMEKNDSMKQRCFKKEIDKKPDERHSDARFRSNRERERPKSRSRSQSRRRKRNRSRDRSRSRHKSSRHHRSRSRKREKSKHEKHRS